MHRFYISPETSLGDSLVLAGSEAHHAQHVLRVARGDRVTVLDGAGHELLCEVVAAERTAVRLTVRQRNELPPLPCAVTLMQAVTKARSMDLIVQKATELGCARIVPVLSERSVPQLDAREGRRKAEKWAAIAIEALKQCGTPFLPRIEPPIPLKDCLAHGERFDLSLVASLQPGARHPREPLEDYRSERHAAPRKVAVWIGPEGDFAPSELVAIRSTGALPVTLGPLVLRSETAAIYCLSFLNYELQSPPHPQAWT